MREIRTSGATRGAGELSLLPPTLPLFSSRVISILFPAGPNGCSVICRASARWHNMGSAAT